MSMAYVITHDGKISNLAFTTAEVAKAWILGRINENADKPAFDDEKLYIENNWSFVYMIDSKKHEYQIHEVQVEPF